MPNTPAAQPRTDSLPRDEGPVAPAPVFTNILCAVDGTNASIAAVRMAAALAGSDGQLTLLTVTAESSYGPNAMAVVSPGRANRILESAKRIAEDAGVSCSTFVDPGAPPAEIILARASDHDLLAIGAPATSWLSGMLISHASSSLGGLITGGVTATVLGRLETPMLVVREPFVSSLNARRILVASDGEQGSDQLVELAGRLAQSQHAQVSLVNALEGESSMNPRAIQAQAATLKRMLTDTAEPWIEPGHAGTVVLNAAQSIDAALVVMGSRRLEGARALGSVSRRVVHDAPCSVLVVPPSDKPAPEQTEREGS